MLNSHFKIVYNQLTEGIDIKVLHQDESMIMTQLMIQRGTILPEHIHQSNHSSYLLQGKICIMADGNATQFVQGDSWCMEKNICHSTEALEDSILLEVFNPDGEIEGFKVHHSTSNSFSD